LPAVDLHGGTLLDDTGAEMSDDSGAVRLSSTTLHHAELLGERLRALGWTCATAESCTGGGIALGITSIPGSSDYMVGGFVAYSNQVKAEQLDVAPETLASVGAVSEACAREMARGVRRRFGVELGISSTGIAGPGGATARKPVGLVYIAVSTPGAEAARELHLPGDRLTVMREAAAAAIDLALTTIGAQSPYAEQMEQSAR
jgi:PncC family amidohydrolase